MSDGYAGDLLPKEAWRLLSDDEAAILVDVRTTAEWAYVGLPDLSPISKEPMRLSWQLFPAMQVNTEFVKTLLDIDRKTPIILLCRSGVRSKAAAKALTKAGYTHAYNVAEGFEGPHDGAKHRGHLGGWKAAGLPWVQG